jgi:hypothetical protein
MSHNSAKLIPVWLRASVRNRAWLFVLLAILLSISVRVRLRDMPLERDEGEYAYAGQLILQGVPPYQDACNMKLPGTYAAYALIMAVFGQTPSGIHIGLALVNAATIWLLYLLGRKLLDASAGATAAVAYALLSLSPHVLGLAGHATHFVVLPALGGVLLLLRALEKRPTIPSLDSIRSAPESLDWRWLFLSGALFGVAFVMKQHGLFFGIFGGLCLVWARLEARLLGPGQGGLGSDYAPRRRAGKRVAVGWPGLLLELAVYAGGIALPYLLTCLVLWLAGVFPQFWFWTVTYGSKYASAIPLVKASDLTSSMLKAVVGPNLVFWLLPWVGAVMMWWDERLNVNRRFLLTALCLCSLASISVGFYFREHYFILVLPVLALLIAVAVSRSLDLLGRSQELLRKQEGLELFLAIAVLAVSVIATGAVLIGNGAIWFAQSPRRAVESIYTTSVFGDARDLSAFIRTNAAPEARIAVLGSEPEIYFYSRRRSATGHIYTYALMERHPYAVTMQDEMIRQIETARPEYLVYVNNNFSWLAQPDSNQRILEWWPAYWASNYALVSTVNTRQGATEFAEKNPAPPGSSGNYLLLLKRKN